MQKKHLAAAIKVARQVCAIDSLDKEEATVLVNELLSFNLSQEERDDILSLVKSLSIFQAVETIVNSDEQVKKETAALCIVSINADGDCSDKEIGAYCMLKDICELPAMNYSEAKEYLKL